MSLGVVLMARILSTRGRMIPLGEPFAVDPREVAHALSHLCRFTGHARLFYSVAHHTYIMARRIPAMLPEQRLAALLHDAAEAYIGDVATPLKEVLPDYRRIEAGVEAAVENTYDISFADHAAWLKPLDRVFCEVERSALLPPTPEWPMVATTVWTDLPVVGKVKFQFPAVLDPPDVIRYRWLNLHDKLCLITGRDHLVARVKASPEISAYLRAQRQQRSLAIAKRRELRERAR